MTNVASLLPETHPSAQTGARDRAIFATLATLTLAMVFLQKLGINIGDAAVGLDWPIMWASCALLLALGFAQFRLSQFVLFLALVFAILAGQALIGASIRPTAIALLLLAYIPFAIQIRVSRALFERCLSMFQSVMVVVALVVIVQQIVQYTIGNSYWPDLERIIPPSLLYPGFAYLRPYSWDPTRLTPNGVFLLEPSVLSYYLALATTIELTVLRNISRLWLYLLAMLACLAVTGPAALVLASPLLLPGMQPGMRRALLLLIVPLAAAAVLTGAFSPLLGRLGELGAVNSSGYGRIVAPLLAIADQATNDPNWLLGYGAGSSPRADNVVQWPFSKLMYEYGLIVAIVFHLYLLSCVFSERRSRAVVFVALIPYLFFGGGFVSHASVMPLLLLGSLLKVEEQGNQAPVNDRTRS